MNYLELTAIKIIQPLGEFYVTKIPANKLLDFAFSEELEYTDEEGNLRGNQRVIDEKRLKGIARYIDSVEMAFPSSIILAANYSQKESRILDSEGDSKIRWTVKNMSDELYKITIPTHEKLAAIIDGQHRLQAFKYVANENRKELELVCTIFFDLPNSYQAFLFATINGNQKKVDQSLALEQFGFNVGKEPPKSWSPEKLAVSMTRKLNKNVDSPFHMKIKLAPIDDNTLFKGGQTSNWFISTATVVNGILSLISSKPKRDRVEMGQKKLFSGRDRSMLKPFNDSTPLRSYYMNSKDEKIQKIVVDFFNSVKETLWACSARDSYIFRTVGIQALFDVLKKILQSETDLDKVNFDLYLKPISNVNFSDNFYQASGAGRSRIKNTILFAHNMVNTKRWKAPYETNIKRLLNKNGTAANS